MSPPSTSLPFVSTTAMQAVYPAQLGFRRGEKGQALEGPQRAWTNSSGSPPWRIA